MFSMQLKRKATSHEKERLNYWPSKLNRIMFHLDHLMISLSFLFFLGSDCCPLKYFHEFACNPLLFIQLEIPLNLIAVRVILGSNLRRISKKMGKSNRGSWFAACWGWLWQQLWEDGTLFVWAGACFEEWFVLSCIPVATSTYQLWDQLSSGMDHKPWNCYM